MRGRTTALIPDDVPRFVGKTEREAEMPPFRNLDALVGTKEQALNSQKQVVMASIMAYA
jgi:hypothetical protein